MVEVLATFPGDALHPSEIILKDERRHIIGFSIADAQHNEVTRYCCVAFVRCDFHMKVVEIRAFQLTVPHRMYSSKNVYNFNEKTVELKSLLSGGLGM